MTAEERATTANVLDRSGLSSETIRYITNYANFGYKPNNKSKKSSSSSASGGSSGGSRKKRNSKSSSRRRSKR